MDAQTKYHLVMGREYYRTGDHDKAQEHLEAVLASHAFADAHNLLGKVHYESGRLERALEHFEAALELNPYYTEAALNLALCYNETGRYDDAKRVYIGTGMASDGGGLATLDPYVRGRIANMHGELGDAYAAVHLYDEAIREYRAALRVSPTYVDIRTKLATLLREQGAVEESLDELLRTLKTNPAYLPGRIQLGVTLWRSGRVAAAREQWGYVLINDPANRTCNVYLKMTEHECET